MGIPGEASVTLMRSASHATALALLLLAGASPLRAQSVQGRVLALPGETPVSGALVALVDSAGGDVARAATSASGGFTLAAPHTGMYRITVNQIGWEAWRSPSFVLTTRSSQPVVLHIQAQPYTLAPLTVEARRSRCGVQLGSPEPGFHLHGELRAPVPRLDLGSSEPRLNGWVETGGRVRSIRGPDGQIDTALMGELLKP